jgi:hypothetical protein
VLKKHGVTSEAIEAGYRSPLYFRQRLIDSGKLPLLLCLSQIDRAFLKAPWGTQKQFDVVNNLEVFGRYLFHLFGVGGNDHDLFRIVCEYL